MKPETIPSLTQSNAGVTGCPATSRERPDKKYLTCKNIRTYFAPDVVVCCYCGRVGHSSDECRWPR